ncbi:ribose ABC transporter permease [Clostridium massiliodielmoense]|uniref:ribose ABC transporter permease n=1 Tax=Clostridium massiliodielmoense TaxID=1776385 RepID=UPI000166783C|nr:ribose ABC transporter permease [Clostridium massiliodielmoense]EDS77680.1 ABC transporter, carbohydrate uptake transporter-2 [Clostridium botulinum C str. Eklund]KEH93303.1 ribose ABC transporter permease [Clostridium botulinum C/D str. BKT12695]NEZ50348.1 ribose ABC transporter permease [Clostridium botulinum]
MKNNFKDIVMKYKALLGLLVLCIVMAILSPRFLTVPNIKNVLTQVSVNAIIAIGMTFVILTGGIDLSVGSTLAISGAVAATLIKANCSILVAIIVAIIVGIIVGLVNGVVIAKGKIQAFIATLATMTVFRGVTQVYTNGTPVSKLGEAFGKIGNTEIIGIPLPVVITIAVFLVAFYVLNETRCGRYIYALGGNEDSARLSGINTTKMKMLVYVISGVTAAISGVVVTSRIGSASAIAGTGYELDAIAAVVLGGTSLAGGEGSIAGTIIGALIIGVLNNGLNLLNVSPYYQLIVKGLVILLAVMVDRKANKK